MTCKIRSNMGPVAPEKKKTPSHQVFSLRWCPSWWGQGRPARETWPMLFFQVRKVIFWGNMGKTHPKKKQFVKEMMNIDETEGLGVAINFLGLVVIVYLHIFTYKTG